MPTLPLYLPHPAHPDASHRVIAPGGYEWWHFEAEDTAQDVQVFATFYDGFPFDPEYARRYDRYRRRPTVWPPPVPRDFPCVDFAASERGRPLARFTSRPEAGRLEASAERLDVRAGLNAVSVDSDAALRVELRETPSASVSAELRFRPLLTHRPTAIELFRQATGGGRRGIHRWIVADPLCGVEGILRLGPRTLTVSGRGYHDHHYGTAPPQRRARRWLRGRAVLGGRVFAFQSAWLTSQASAYEGHVMVADEAGVRELTGGGAGAGWSYEGGEEPPYKGTHPAYPEAVDFAGPLRLTGPKMIESTPAGFRVSYDAVADGDRGTAMCWVS